MVQTREEDAVSEQTNETHDTWHDAPDTDADGKPDYPPNVSPDALSGMGVPMAVPEAAEDITRTAMEGVGNYDADPTAVEVDGPSNPDPVSGGMAGEHQGDQIVVSDVEVQPGGSVNADGYLQPGDDNTGEADPSLQGVGERAKEPIPEDQQGHDGAITGDQDSSGTTEDRGSEHESGQDSGQESGQQ
jgi:hypothetical protein